MTPSATALAITARPIWVGVIGTVIGLFSVVCGLVLAAMFNLPPSFFIITVAVVIWAATLTITRERHRSAEPGPPWPHVPEHHGDHAGHH